MLYNNHSRQIFTIEITQSIQDCTLNMYCITNHEEENGLVILDCITNHDEEDGLVILDCITEKKQK